MRPWCTRDWIGQFYYSTVMAWNTDTVGKDGAKPTTWADFYNVEKFPGTRSVYDHPRGNLEIALLADGVDPAKLYPLDVDRAFKKLATLKPSIGIWWNSGAQSRADHQGRRGGFHPDLERSPCPRRCATARRRRSPTIRVC